MYKVMFLDDEPVTLLMLESAMDWQKYRVSVCGSATDGAEGIELFRQFEPDIVIADIRMPKMNGIEFARAIRETKKKVKILLLSAYAEFEYAQSAITYQISDYLLKPLDEDKLEAAIMRIVQELDREYSVSSTMELYRVERAEKQLQQLFLQAHERVTIPDEVRAVFGAADVLIDVLRVAEPQEYPLQIDLEGVRLFFKDRLGSYTAAISISPIELIVLTSSIDLQDQPDALLSALRLRGQPVRFGISRIDPTFDLLRAFHQAENALDQCFYSGAALGFYSDDQLFSSDSTLNFTGFEQAIAELVEQGKSDELIESMNDHLSELFAKRLNPALLYDFVFDVLNWVKIAIARQYPAAPVVELAAVDRVQLRACATKAILVAFLTEYLQTIAEMVNHMLEADAGYYIVRRTKDYVRAHYTEAEFSLQTVADDVGLSKNHLSRVFHETTGMKFWDYVTQLRIEKAKELLRQSNRSNYEICRAIGYQSEFYFSKIFKRVVGVAAQEFRRL